jgi:hypothetical protein
MAEASARFRVGHGSQDVGSYSVREINQMLATGQLAASDYYYDYSLKSWRPIVHLRGVLLPIKDA